MVLRLRCSVTLGFRCRWGVLCLPSGGSNSDGCGGVAGRLLVLSVFAPAFRKAML